MKHSPYLKEPSMSLPPWKPLPPTAALHHNGAWGQVDVIFRPDKAESYEPLGQQPAGWTQFPMVKLVVHYRNNNS